MNLTKTKTEIIENYRQVVTKANKETPKKEAFISLLNQIYGHNEDTKKVIDAITGGAETPVINIPRKDEIKRGSADTLYNKVIIEFENDIKSQSSLKHAKEQLAGYLLGQYRTGNGSDYVLIASDCLNWKVFAIDVEHLDKLDSLNEHELKLNEAKTSSFTLTKQNGEDFYYWIDRFLFKEQRQKATLELVEQAFGYNSPVFQKSYGELQKHFREVSESGEIKVSFEQWEKFLSIAYGGFDATEKNFLIHTYLSVFSKMIAYAVVSNDDYLDDLEIRGIIDGSIFAKFNLSNFVENDFFHWVKNEKSFPALKEVFRRIAQELSAFDFEKVDEDILKGVYQNLIDLDTRQSLGEYYTPDWLCERIVNEFDFKKTDKILDPSCGSGSFLRAVIHRLKTQNPDITIEELNEAVRGIDIHPLSVQIAKTTMLIAYGKEVINAKSPIFIDIMLANTVLLPQGIGDMFGSEFLMEIDDAKIPLTTEIFNSIEIYDKAVAVADDLANRQGEVLMQATFEANLKNKLGGLDVDGQSREGFYKIYEKFKSVKDIGRDSIWRFILQNLYKPYFLKEKFDYVIGNPPWFTYSSIRNESYQDTLFKLAEKYDVKPERKANFPHLEIAAIFMAHCSEYFLKDGGKIAFVLPRSFFSADHHDNTRSGKSIGFDIYEAWDLDGVSPLFRVPSCVLFASKEAYYAKTSELQSRKLRHHEKISKDGFNGKLFSGKLKKHNSNLLETFFLLKEDDTKLYYVKQGSSTAFSQVKMKSKSEPNPYKNDFKQGATIVPRSLYFVDINQQMPPDFEDRIINIRTAEAVKSGAKKPWTNIDLQGRIESRFLFRTALSKSILPFALFAPELVVLPLTIEENEKIGKKIKLHTSDELLEMGFSDASDWFAKAEELWNERRTKKNQKISAKDYLNWQNKLTDQDLNAPYLVLYNSSAKDANATIVKREDIDFEFIADHKAYLFSTQLLGEAHYLTAIFNSSVPNKLIKDFQSRGLFGARDIHKKILDIYYPRFDRENELHKQLAVLSETAHTKAEEFLRETSPNADLSPHELGKIRLDVKKFLSDEMTQIDELVQNLIS
ncbi:N-6 DNA methylase [soil metagenome]